MSWPRLAAEHLSGVGFRDKAASRGNSCPRPDMLERLLALAISLRAAAPIKHASHMVPVTAGRDVSDRPHLRPPKRLRLQGAFSRFRAPVGVTASAQAGTRGLPARARATERASGEGKTLLLQGGGKAGEIGPVPRSRWHPPAECGSGKLALAPEYLARPPMAAQGNRPQGPATSRGRWHGPKGLPISISAAGSALALLLGAMGIF